VGGPDGIIFKTNDGGINWTSILSGTSFWLNSLCFTDSNTGYAVGCHSTGDLYTEGGIILKTLNGGTTWMEVYVGDGGTGCLNSVYFSDANTGFVVGDDGTIIKTINAGTTWTDIYSGTTNSLYSAYFTDTNTGYVAGEGGTILKTNDGGGTVGITEEPVVSRQSSVIRTLSVLPLLLNIRLKNPEWSLWKYSTRSGRWSQKWSMNSKHRVRTRRRGMQMECPQEFIIIRSQAGSWRIQVR
jgi:photosystem II stability/assembly factor-like uncharacterized protein